MQKKLKTKATILNLSYSQFIEHQNLIYEDYPDVRWCEMLLQKCSEFLYKN